MIARMVYLMCDDCGNPGPLEDNVRDARKAAKRAKWSRSLLDGDLCPKCVAARLDEEQLTG